ncbi:MAG TPA: lysylphosphatidylglycerol synthase transmembrane domain-containing protein [Agriterribacter sp.]|nr:lysylphosphatidylglycerol synthase transmembrane domain-containing protein [Agriterribacter sp.]
MDRKRIWNIVKLFLKLAVTGVALWLVYKNIDTNALALIWENANAWLFVPAFLFFALSQYISSFRLLNFFRNIQLAVPVTYNLVLYIQGMFYNIFLPGGIGGDGYKILAIHKQFRAPRKDIFSAVFFDRLSGLWALCFLIVVLSLFVPLFNEYTWLVAAGFVFGTVAYYLVIRYFFARHIYRFFRVHALALLVQSCQLICVLFILNALGCTGSYLSYLIIFLLSTLATLFPFSIGGLGAREIAMVWAATILFLNKDMAVSVSLCFYFISAILSLTGVIFLFRQKTTDTATAMPASSDFI